MISMTVMFWILVALFSVIGILRGWTKEVIATSGLVLAMFALTYFGNLVTSLFGASIDPTTADPDALRRRQFYILSLILLVFAFFSYQGPALAGSRLSDRLRIRDSLQDKILGALIGAVNGYLLVGSLWSFLEYPIGPNGYTQLPPGVNYPFAMEVMIRPGTSIVPATALVNYLPLPLLAPYLPFLVVVVFLFVIVVMI